MNNRYKKIIFEDREGRKFEAIAENDRNFEISEGTNGELIIKATDVSVTNREKRFLENYTNPPIPKGYRHTEGEWYDGFVIQRESDGSELVWIPVGFLDANGTLDGKKFNEKFGRRNYYKDEFSVRKFYEEMTEELWEQRKSVEKYGGFYISRYIISDGASFYTKPQSKKGVKPLISIFEYAQEHASQFENTDEVKSHLTYGCEYDCVLEWFFKTKAKTLVFETDGNKETCTNNIYNFAGKVDEWTQEKYYVGCSVIRFGSVRDIEEGNLRSFRIGTSIKYDNNLGFRVALLIK